MKCPHLILNRAKMVFHHLLELNNTSFGNRRTIAPVYRSSRYTCNNFRTSREPRDARHYYSMETIVVTIKGVKVFVDEKSASVQLTLEKAIKGFTRDADGNYVEADVKTISIHRSKLTAQLCDISDDIAMYRATLDHAFGQKEFGVILFNAQLTLNRQLVVAGEVIGEGDDAVTAERDCYLTDVTKVKLSDRALRELDKAISL